MRKFLTRIEDELEARFKALQAMDAAKVSERSREEHKAGIMALEWVKDELKGHIAEETRIRRAKLMIKTYSPGICSGAYILNEAGADVQSVAKSYGVIKRTAIALIQAGYYLAEQKKLTS